MFIFVRAKQMLSVLDCGGGGYAYFTQHRARHETLHTKQHYYMAKTLSFFLLICTISFFQIQAQNTPMWGADHTLKEKPEDFGGVACFDGEGTVVWHIGLQGFVKKNVSLYESYGVDLRLIASSLPPELYNDSETQFFRAFKLGSTVYALFLGNSEGKLALMAWPMDRQTMKMPGEPMHLYDIDRKFSKQNLRYGLNFFQLAFNADSTEMALAFHYDAHKGIRVCVFDRNLKLLWENVHFADRLMEYLPFRDHRIYFHNGIVSLMYSSVMTKEENKASSQKGYTNHAYHALVFRDKGAVVQDVWINLGAGFFPVSLEAIPQADGKIRCVGAYTEQQGRVEFLPDSDETRPMAGIYEWYIGTDGKTIGTPAKSKILPLLQENKTSFDKESKTNYYKHPELAGFIPVKIVELPNQALTLIFEFTYFPLESPRRSSGDILVTRLANNGTLTWANIIPKKQSFVNTAMARYASHGFFQEGNKLHFVYTQGAQATAPCSWSTIDDKGNVTTKKDWLTAEQNAGAMPTHGIALKDGFLMPAIKVKTIKLALIKL